MYTKSYKDFNPKVILVTEAATTLELHLPDFRKEHLRIQLDKDGNLKISGERPLEGNTWERFQYNYKVVKDSKKSNEIQAKFISGILHIALPTMSTKKVEQEYHQQSIPTQEMKNEVRTAPTVVVINVIAIAVVVGLQIYAIYKLGSSGTRD